MSNISSPQTPQRDPETEQPPFNWREHLRIHPAADLFPPMSAAELKELASDIWKNGLRAPIVGWASSEGQFLLDGRNRLDALAQLGLLYETIDHHVGLKKWGGEQWSDRPGGRIESECEFKNFHYGDPYAIALSLNVHRRHLTNEDKDRLIAELIKANPEKSNRQIAEQVKSNHPHVGKIRTGLEKASDVETVSTSIDTKGRKQPRRHAGKPAKTRKSVSAEPLTTSAVEIGGRLCVELVAHVVNKASPAELDQLLRKKLKPESIGALFKYFDQVRNSHTRATAASPVIDVGAGGHPLSEGGGVA
jgi:hypothetical protein